ncbi:MAG: glutamate synthase [Rhodospirillaceae bacterium]|nr:glutamate synthase [Rhodospirillaceae bacterium]|tara:strand:+ start:14426 stop:16960 length:2535 start_codon:yes stop_codon:yes gene_type:complete
MSRDKTNNSTAPRPLMAELPDDTSDLHFVPAPCQIACPVGTDAPSYIAHIWDGEYEKAYEAITATNPFSSICGRVCDAPCEPACRRTDSDGPVQIRNLKRFVMDKVGHDYDPPPLSVTQKQTVAVVGSGPAGMVAVHDLCESGFEVHLYEMTDRLGGMMIWGIPAFRLPQHVIQEDIDRLTQRCPGLKVHLNTALGTDISLDELKQRHDAVILAIGSWWGKKMEIPGEEDERVIDGVQFLRDINAGARPEMPETVVVIGGGDVAMDACRAALRLPGCEKVKVVYRRGSEDIPARKIELQGAIEEGIEFIYNTQQIAIEPTNSGLNLQCVTTEAGPPDEDGRSRPVVVENSEHFIPCGMVIAAVGQQGKCEHLNKKGMMLTDRVDTNWENMRTDDPKVFAAGDGAFGGSTIVMAMSHGQRVAYYVKAFLEGRDSPLPYKTPYKTRRVPVAQDQLWEKLPVQEPVFHGVGENPVEFPEIEDTYGREDALKEAARCYRCDAETGSTDYAVKHREDIFTMARTNPLDHNKLKDTLKERLGARKNPYPDERLATLDDLAFLPANLSRLVIDPYREACNTKTELGEGKMSLSSPFLVTGFDDAESDVKRDVGRGLALADCGYLGIKPLNDEIPWIQLVIPDQIEPSGKASGLIYSIGHKFKPVDAKRLNENQLLGISVSSSQTLQEAIPFALENNFDVLLLDATGALGSPWSELKGNPDISILRDAVNILRELDREEEIDLVYFGGLRSGTDAAKVIGLGGKVVVYGVVAGLAAGGQITDQHSMHFEADRTSDDRSEGVTSILKACANEASMMARCTGKTNLMNIEPEDMRAISSATAKATGIPVAGNAE